MKRTFCIIYENVYENMLETCINFEVRYLSTVMLSYSLLDSCVT